MSVVLPKHHVAVTSGVIDYNFRGTNFGDGFLEGSGQAGWVGHVCGLSVYGCGWGGGGVERGKLCETMRAGGQCVSRSWGRSQ